MSPVLDRILGGTVAHLHRNRWLVVEARPFFFGVTVLHHTDVFLVAWAVALFRRVGHWFQGVEDLYLVVVVDRRKSGGSV